MSDSGGVHGVSPDMERSPPVCAGDASEAGDFEMRRRQTEAWCMHVPNEKKNIHKMQMVFVDGFAKFIPK